MRITDATKVSIAAMIFFAAALVVYCLGLSGPKPLDYLPHDEASAPWNAYNYATLILAMMGAGCTIAAVRLYRSQHRHE
jgi:hypothetical protein